MSTSQISPIILVFVLYVLVSTVKADVNLDLAECSGSQSHCDAAFTGPQPVLPPKHFLRDSEIGNYCRNYKNEYIEWAVCSNTIRLSCYKPEERALYMSNSGVRSSISYYCQRIIDGFTFDITCEGMGDNPQLVECLRELDEITTPSSNNITYEGLKYNICRNESTQIKCIRNNDRMKTICPGSQTTYSTVIQKQLPPACEAYNQNGTWSLIVITILISLLNY